MRYGIAHTGKGVTLIWVLAVSIKKRHHFASKKKLYKLILSLLEFKNSDYEYSIF